VDITVTLSVEKLEHKAEALVRVPGNDIFVEADSADMYASIDDLVDKLDRQLVRRKEKMKASVRIPFKEFRSGQSESTG
jgi:putative sigma-54 modulation protein